MPEALARHDAILRETIATHEGVVFRTVGDAFCAAFVSATAALATALAVQRALLAERWGPTGPLLVRMALHTGLVDRAGADYQGLPLNRLASLLAVAHAPRCCSRALRKSWSASSCRPMSRCATWARIGSRT